MPSLSPKTGALGKRLAAHLLRRATYHISPSIISNFASMTAEQAVNALFVFPAYVHSEGPLNHIDGTAWLTTGPYSSNVDDPTRQRRAVQMWLYNELLQDTSIRHKMTYFYNSIFVTASDRDWRVFDLWRLFQQFATGNIKTLAYKVTLDNKMLVYLNNNLNKKASPNENYAREFLELFTILKGEQIETGNYTNYTEYDIQQTARVLTGFTVDGFDNKDPDTGLATGKASYNNHDVGNKQFSAAFQNQIILGATSQADMFRELQDFVDMVFNQLETAKAFCRRLYRFFVSDKINAEVESDIIEPLALQLKNDNYEVAEILKKLLKSKHFYDEDDEDSTNEIIGGKLKSPLELYLSSINLFDANQLGVLNNTPNYYNNIPNYLINSIIKPMGFPEFAATVEGYPGFYKAPNYSHYWFDQSNIAPRFKLADSLIRGKTVINNRSIPFKIDVVSFFQQNFINHLYADELVTQFLEITLPEMPDSERYEYFRQKLLGGLSPINWHFDWEGYLENGDASSVEVALKALFEAVATSPEFQTF